jgi:hypothetical protein
VFVKPLDTALHERSRQALLANRTHARVAIIRGPIDLLGRELLVRDDAEEAIPGEQLDQVLREKARQAIGVGRSQRYSLEWENETIEIFVEVVKPAPTLVIVGGVRHRPDSPPKTLGYAIVVDPRQSFGNPSAFRRRLVVKGLGAFSGRSQCKTSMLTHVEDHDRPAHRAEALRSMLTLGARRPRRAAAASLVMG